MKGNDNKESIDLIEISPSPVGTRLRGRSGFPFEKIDLDTDSSEVEVGTPLRPIFCLKKKADIKIFEEKEECFILDFDPEDSLNHSNLSPVKDFDNSHSPDIFVIGEKGQVACRDYPHSRHVCATHPFDKTSHESYCKLCYCYVCDITAPCKKWSGSGGHCHAFDNEAWRHVRKVMKQIGLPEQLNI